jgi:hypothetical protein
MKAQTMAGSLRQALCIRFPVPEIGNKHFMKYDVLRKFSLWVKLRNYPILNCNMLLLEYGIVQVLATVPKC